MANFEAKNTIEQGKNAKRTNGTHFTRVQGGVEKTLRTLTSLNKEVRPFSQAIVAFGVFPLLLPLAITAFGAPEGYFSLAIVAFGAFEFIVPKYKYRLGKTNKRRLESLI